MKFLCIVPIFNEESKLKALLEEIVIFRKKNLNLDFLLINNGSTDKSLEIIKKYDFRVISFDKNYGVGFALIQGLSIAIKEDYNFVIHLAGNGKMDPMQIELFLEKVIQEQYNFVSGSRFLEKNSYATNPIARIFMIRVLSFFIRAIYKKKITDATCGFRCFEVKLFKKHFEYLNKKKFYTYKYEYYTFGKALLCKNVRFTEVSVSMRYTKKNYSKIKPIIDWIPIIFGWVEARFDSKKI